jgi:hypothetical protein
MSSFFTAIGHQSISVQTGGIVPVIIKAVSYPSATNALIVRVISRGLSEQGRALLICSGLCRLADNLQQLRGVPCRQPDDAGQIRTCPRCMRRDNLLSCQSSMLRPWSCSSRPLFRCTHFCFRCLMFVVSFFCSLWRESPQPPRLKLHSNIHHHHPQRPCSLVQK